jgi:hypothetical protein
MKVNRRALSIDFRPACDLPANVHRPSDIAIIRRLRIEVANATQDD